MGNTICCEHDLPDRRGYPYPPACLYDTVDMMVSKDYKERFKAEYWQTRIRYEKLKKLNTQLEAHEDILKDEKGPKHDSPAYLLRNQQRQMGEYLHILELRAEFEHIEL